MAAKANHGNEHDDGSGNHAEHMNERGQAYTMEAFVAATILLASVLFALQVTAVTPLTASTSSQHIENQQGATAEGVLATAADAGDLRETLLYWNNSRGVHWQTGPRGTYSNGGPPTEFGETLNETFRDRGIAFDLTVYVVDSGDTRVHEIVDFGEPSDNAVAASRIVTLYDDDRLLDAAGDPTTTTVSRSGTYFVRSDGAPNSGVYSVVTVEVVVWRM